MNCDDAPVWNGKDTHNCRFKRIVIFSRHVFLGLFKAIIFECFGDRIGKRMGRIWRMDTDFFFTSCTDFKQKNQKNPLESA